MRIFLAVLAALLVGIGICYGVGQLIYLSLEKEDAGWIFPVAVAAGLIVAIPIGVVVAKKPKVKRDATATNNKATVEDESHKISIKTVIAGILLIIVGILGVIWNFSFSLSSFQILVVILYLALVVFGYESIRIKRDWIWLVAVSVLSILGWILHLPKIGPMIFMIMGFIALVLLLISKKEFGQKK